MGRLFCVWRTIFVFDNYSVLAAAKLFHMASQFRVLISNVHQFHPNHCLGIDGHTQGKLLCLWAFCSPI